VEIFDFHEQTEHFYERNAIDTPMFGLSTLFSKSPPFYF